MKLSLKHKALRLLGHQHYLPHGRDKIIRIFHSPDTSDSIPFEIDFFGMKYRGNLNNFLDWSVFYFGGAPTNEIYLLRDIVRAIQSESAQPICFYDVGANIGHHTLFMSPLVDSVFSFEPFDLAREKLYEKIERNGLANVTVFPVALGDEDSELVFFEPDDVNPGMGTFVPDGESRRRPTRKMAVYKGDPFFEKNKLPKIDILKIDVEGFESRVLRGLRSRICQDRPIIMMEMLEAARKKLDNRLLTDYLYEGASIFEIGCTSISSSYRISPVDFSSSMEILVVPNEKLAVLKDVLTMKGRK